MKATGQFEVKLNPMKSFAKGKDGINLGRMSIDKTFKGDLEAISTGEMLSAMTAIQGSAGYVAIEQVHGRLADRKGSFVLQHYGIIHAGDEFLKLEIIPESASDDLKGLSGWMKIKIEDGVHFYELDYKLKEKLL